MEEEIFSLTWRSFKRDCRERQVPPSRTGIQLPVVFETNFWFRNLSVSISTLDIRFKISNTNLYIQIHLGLVGRYLLKHYTTEKNVYPYVIWVYFIRNSFPNAAITLNRTLPHYYAQLSAALSSSVMHFYNTNYHRYSISTSLSSNYSTSTSSSEAHVSNIFLFYLSTFALTIMYYTRFFIYWSRSTNFALPGNQVHGFTCDNYWKNEEQHGLLHLLLWSVE